jgi:hypothetical protein
MGTNIEINFAGNKPNYGIKMDQKGDRVFREKINPSSILNAQESADHVKPETKAEIVGQTVKLTADDDNSKVLKIEYSLDEGKTWNTYTKAINLDQISGAIIQYRSTDRAGNMEDIKEQTINKNANKPSLSNFRKIRF